MLDSLLFPLLSYLIPHSIDFIPSKVPSIILPFHFPSHQPLQIIISHMNYFNGLLTDLSTYFQPLHTLSNIHKELPEFTHFNLPTEKPRVPSYCFKSKVLGQMFQIVTVERYYISAPKKPIFFSFNFLTNTVAVRLLHASSFQHGEGNGIPLQYSCLENPMDGGAWQAAVLGIATTSLSLFTFMHWRRKWQPTPVFLPGESQGRGSLVGCSLWGQRVRHNLATEHDLTGKIMLSPKVVKESACNAGDPGSTSGLGRSPGEGNGNPLQYSCLENPMDKGIWWATVHGVTKSQTRLSD